MSNYYKHYLLIFKMINYKNPRTLRDSLILLVKDVHNKAFWNYQSVAILISCKYGNDLNWHKSQLILQY